MPRRAEVVHVAGASSHEQPRAAPPQPAAVTVEPVAADEGYRTLSADVSRDLLAAEPGRWQNIGWAWVRPDPSRSGAWVERTDDPDRERRWYYYHGSA